MFFEIMLCVFTLFLVTMLSGCERTEQKDKVVDVIAKDNGKNIQNTKKIAYLTFDDGPSCLTEKYLDILESEGVKATFFVIGQQINGEEQTIKREISQGHEIGVHTYCHEADRIYCNCDTYYKDVIKVKNILKKQILWAIPLAFSLLTSSCSDYLDKLPENTVEVEGIDYTNKSNMYMPVSGVYATARGYLGSWSSYGCIIVRGDDVNKGGSPTDQIEYEYASKFQYDRLTTFWALSGLWGNCYYVVSTSNSALESLENYAKHLTSESDKQLNAQYAAEVRFFRAYAYFQLVNLFGDVPLLLDNQELNVFKNTKEDVKKYIYDELDYCIANLPAIRPNESEHPGAVTKYTAEMLKAKQKMYDNEWDEVLALTEDIVNSGKFELYNDFYELFKIPGKLCNESLLEYQFTDFGNGSGDIVSSDNWFAFQGPRGEAPISGWAFIEPTEKIRNLFSKRGEAVRAETTFLMTDATTRDGDYIPVAQPGEPTAYNGKAYTPANQMTPGRTGYGDNNNIRVFRYADVLLMNAEAKVRKGQNGDAPLNLVRERAGLAPIANATLDQILEERQVELALEWGERFFDLVRTDRATQELPGFVKGESEYYPIPQDQIDLNPNLEAEPVPFEPEVTE